MPLPCRPVLRSYRLRHTMALASWEKNQMPTRSTPTVSAVRRVMASNARVRSVLSHRASSMSTAW